ncbi:argininosuccinate synthase [Thermosediminibacter oceani]|uniref:Argininosuccinate synthase n=1 Tax=Thermosediminibacter oceani (strain ATCC BAA-1034 / DSM 16646 / JW/IW-1228P) TaxID=555079 RepID=D9S019_THEOJ|nr:argininosuccinate synthase [Thermosediminibacter oceani]ADL06947.1 argininosuccinate synthase [Thermosediminibacter oceani DSM 16646]
MKKVVLAYSGGLDTSVAIKWLKENYNCDVVALCADLGEGKDLEFIKNKAERVGAIKCYVVDAKEEFIKNYAFFALKANALYEGVYPLSAALSRPLISKLLVDVARREGAFAVAHGCTGKGNDQVRFDVSVAALAPDLKVIAPVREWPMSREEEIEYAVNNGIPVPVGRQNPFSIDQNLWGRSIECGVLEDPWVEPPEEVFQWTVSPEKTPDEPTYVEITFEKGVPVALNGKEMAPVELVQELNKIAGNNGFGRIDHVENRLVGIKSREVYECPASLLLINAHRNLESLTLPREVLHFKYGVERKYAELIYNGLWYSPLKEALDAFIDETQKVVSGTVKVKLFKGSAMVVGRKSSRSLYDIKLATYSEEDLFEHRAAMGFITLWGLSTKVYARVNKKNEPQTEG